MDIHTTINTRKTIRHFDGKPIESEIVEKLLDAGFKAPANGSMRNWEFVIVNDKDIRMKLLTGVKESVPGTEDEIIKNIESWGLTDKKQKDMYLDAVPKQYSMLYNAGCLILPFFRQESPLLQPDTLSSLNGFASIWCCIENILLAAAAEGIFGVTRIPQGNETEHIKNIIGHPDNYVMPCYLALGYPSQDVKVLPRKEISITDRIHFNLWSK